MLVWNSRDGRFVSCVLGCRVAGMRRGRDACPDHYGHVLDLRSNILRKVVQSDVIDCRRGIAGVQHGFPLDEAGGRSVNGKFLGQIDLLPRAPVAVWIVHVAAAGEKLKVASAANFGPSPLGKYLGIENIALVGALCDRPGTEQENFAEIAGGSVDPARGRTGERGHLVGAGFGEVGVVVAEDGVNLASVASACEQSACRIES